MISHKLTQYFNISHVQAQALRILNHFLVQIYRIKS